MIKVIALAVKRTNLLPSLGYFTKTPYLFIILHLIEELPKNGKH
jgi:hypothetical protein